MICFIGNTEPYSDHAPYGDHDQPHLIRGSVFYTKSGGILSFDIMLKLITFYYMDYFSCLAPIVTVPIFQIVFVIRKGYICNQIGFDPSPSSNKV